MTHPRHRYLSIETRLALCIRMRGPDDCWIFESNRDKNGYGALKYRGKKTRAHRLVYMLWIGLVPEGMQVLHTCDNPPCCNPKHLFVGTALDNMQDKMKKGRWAGGCPTGIFSGKRNPNYKHGRRVKSV